MIKKILCKYFAEENTRIVTIGSIIENSIVFILVCFAGIILMLFGLMLTILVVNPSAQTLTEGIISAVKAWGILIGIVLIAAVGYYVLQYLHTIKITECERKE